MSNIEKYHVSVVVIVLIVTAVVAFVYFTGGGINTVAGISGLIGLVGLPVFIFGRKIKEETDEMTIEIDRRSLIAAFRFTWVFMIIVFTWASFLDGDYINKGIIQIVVWAMFALLFFVKSVAYLYYLKKGINDDNKK